MGGIEVVKFGGDNVASARGGVAVDHAIILDAQAADGRGHPAILVAMIVDAAVLADVPAKRHAFKQIVAENEIARVISLGEEAVFLEALGVHGVADDVVDRKSVV